MLMLFVFELICSGRLVRCHACMVVLEHAMSTSTCHLHTRVLAYALVLVRVEVKSQNVTRREALGVT